MKAEGVLRGARESIRKLRASAFRVACRTAWTVGALPYPPSQSISYTRQAYRWLVAIRITAICISVDVSAMLILILIPHGRDWARPFGLGPMLAQLLAIFLAVLVSALVFRPVKSESRLGPARYDISKSGDRS